MPRVMIEVIDESYGRHRAPITQRGIFWNGRWATPISLKVTQLDASKDTGRTIGGAALGGMLAGGAGAIVGAIASGNKGKILFTIRTVEGDQLLCRCAAGQYPKIGGLMQLFFDKVARWQELQISGDYGRGVRSKIFFYTLMFGPFFFAYRFGPVPFVLTFLFIIVTYLIGWLALPFIAVFMHSRERKRWFLQYGKNLANLDVGALRLERRLNFEAEHGLDRPVA